MSKPTPITDALSITYERPTVGVDWSDLGAIVAEQNADDQAAFLDGFGGALDDDDNWLLMQFEHIAEEVRKYPSHRIERTVRALSELLQRLDPKETN